MKIKFLNLLARLTAVHLYDEISNVEDSRYIVDCLRDIAVESKITESGALTNYISHKGLRVILNKLSAASAPVVYFNEDTCEFILASLKLFELNLLGSPFTPSVKVDLLNYYAGKDSIRQNYYHQLLSSNNKIQVIVYKVFFQYFNKALSEDVRKDIICMYELMEDKYKF